MEIPMLRWLSLFLLALTSTVTSAADWPRWRGPDATGISQETGWKSNWGESGVPVLWKSQVGTGYSSLAVASGRLYTLGHRDGNETLFCLDAESGKELWKRTYPAQIVANLHKGGPATTPTIDAGVVYSMSRDGRLMALTAEKGDLLWETQLVGQTANKVPEWGFSSSVIVEGNLLLVESGGVAAFDKGTGKLAWHAGKFKLGYGSPELFTYDGKRYAASLNNQNVQIVDVATGQQVTSSEWVTSYDTNSTTPIAVGDELFISTGYNRGCELLRFNGSGLKQLYEVKTMANHMNNSILWDGYLYGVHGNSHNPSQCALRCIEWKTGKQKWSQRGCGCGSLIVADGKLIVLSDQGLLAIVKASPDKFESISQQQVLSGECWTSPVLANSRIYCRSSDGELVALDVKAR
jgi:outer membrane protein assembly factor BamB